MICRCWWFTIVDDFSGVPVVSLNNPGTVNSDATITCTYNLQNAQNLRQVNWYFTREGISKHIYTYDRNGNTDDEGRYTSLSQGPTNHRLKIARMSSKDQGLYLCETITVDNKRARSEAEYLHVIGNGLLLVIFSFLFFFFCVFIDINLEFIRIWKS